MNRNEYLRDSSVEAFIDWLRPHVRGDCPFQHAFTMRRPRRAWSCNSIWEAYENYWWRDSFKANQEELDRLAADVRCARDGNDQDGFVEAAYAILQWGGVTASNGETLSDLGETALSTFHEASRLLDPPHADTSRLDGVRYMNAGWTKVYALMLDDFPIYDGRVGAAMGYLVQQYCIRAGLRQVPRACGELPDQEASSAVVSGSSPRMRGTRPGLLVGARFTQTRIIPAHAGNSLGPSPTGPAQQSRIIPAHAGNSGATCHQHSPACSTDHPRACGELKTHVLEKRPQHSPDHPRACGELRRLQCIRGRPRQTGSSPRMRGTPVNAYVIHRL